MSKSIRRGVSLIENTFEAKGLSYHNMSGLIDQVDQLTIGLAIGSRTEKTFLDVVTQAKDGTLLAKRINQAATAKSSFKGFVRDNSVVEFHGAASLLAEDKKQLLDLVTKLRLQINKSSWHGKIADPLALILNSVIASGKVDMAGSLLLEDDLVDLIIGFKIANGPEIEKLIGKLMNTIEAGYREQLDIQLNQLIDQDTRVTFHKLAISIPEDQEDARRIFGPRAQFVIGVGPQAIYVGVGEKAIPKIRSAIAASSNKDGKELRGVRLKIQLQPLAEIAARFEEKWRLRFLYEDIAETLRESGKDRITTSLEMKDGVQRFRFEIQEGNLRVYNIAYWAWFSLAHQLKSKAD